MEYPRLTNEVVAELLNVSPSAVSRWRSGDRHPNWQSMQRIAVALKWSASDQLAQRSAGTWHLGFESALRRKFD